MPLIGIYNNLNCSRFASHRILYFWFIILSNVFVWVLPSAHINIFSVFHKQHFGRCPPIYLYSFCKHILVFLALALALQWWGIMAKLSFYIFRWIKRHIMLKCSYAHIVKNTQYWYMLIYSFHQSIKNIVSLKLNKNTIFLLNLVWLFSQKFKGHQDINLFQLLFSCRAS